VADLHSFIADKLYLSETELCAILNRSGSDKAGGLPGKHNYGTLYHYLFAPIRESATAIFELGLGTNNRSFQSNMGGHAIPCGSLRAWREYFPNAEIYGADIDKSILVQEDRIKTYYCDQLDPASIKSMWAHIPEELDVIIDDGLHEYMANRTLLTNSMDKLKPGGLYIVEDIPTRVVKEYVKLAGNLKDLYTQAEVVVLPNANNQHDNNLLVVVK